MFDIGWTEMLVVVCVAIIVVGPKDLPKMLRAFGRTMKTVRGLAGDFQKQFDEAVKEADLDDVKKVASGKGFSPLEDIKKSAAEFEKDVKAQMEERKGGNGEKTESAGLPEPVAKKLAEMDAKKEQAAKAETAPKPKTAKRKPVAKKTAAKTTSKSSRAKKTTAKSSTGKTTSGRSRKKPATSAGNSA